MAVILNKSIFGLRTFRTIYYLPSIMVGVGTYFLWMLLLDPANGLVNSALALIGIKGPAWLTDPNWTKPAIILMHLWGLGGQMLYIWQGFRVFPRIIMKPQALTAPADLRNLPKLRFRFFPRLFLQPDNRHHRSIPDFPGRIYFFRRRNGKTGGFPAVL